MHRHSKFLFIIFSLACIIKAGPETYAAPFRARILLQQDQQNTSSSHNRETQAPREEEVAMDSIYTTTCPDTAYAEDAYDEKEANSSPFPEIITPPERRKRDISDTRWADMTRDEAFRYEDEVPKPQKSSSDGWWSRMFMGIFEFLASTAGNYLIIGIVALIILVIIIRIVQLNGNIFFTRKDRKIGADEIDELSDEYIPENWETVIQEAAKAGNYRLAVRHAYRYMLSLLQQKEMISYQVAKTNHQYAYELTGTRLHKPFMQLTRDYEYAWYGGFDIQQERFEAYYHKIAAIKNELDLKG